MLTRLTMAAAVAFAIPVMADETCLEDGSGAQCDVFFDDYRADEVPVGTTDMWASDQFLVERFHDYRGEPAVELPAGEDVLFWDGDTAMIVSEESGPRFEIADW